MKKESLVVLKFENSKIPDFVERKNSDWVLFGEKNDYPEYLLTLFNRSGKHNAIVTGKANYIAGRGITFNKEGLSDTQASLLKHFVDKANPYESLNDVLLKVALDLEVFGGFALEPVWNRTKTKIVELYHVDFSKIRSNAKSNEFFYSSEWIKNGIPNTRVKDSKDFKLLLPFNPSKPADNQLIYFKQYRPHLDVYPLPEYVGSIPYIETDIEIANFHLSNIKTGFNVGTIIGFNNGIPTQEDQTSIEKALKQKFTGTDRANSMLLNFAESKDKAVTIERLAPSDLDKQFDILNKAVQQEIFTGHKVTSPMLFGIKTEGQLGGRTELVEAHELFQSTYVSPRQSMIEAVINNIAIVNGYDGRLKIQPVEPVKIILGSDVFAQVATTDEKREHFGLPKLNEQPTEAGAKFSSQEIDDKLIEAFSQHGRPKDEVIVLKSRPMRFKSDVDVIKSELDWREQNFADDDFTDLEKKVLDLIKKDALIEAEQIAEALGEDIKKINTTIKSLEVNGVVKQADDGSRKLTKDGNDIHNNTPDSLIDISVMYEYSVAPGMGAPVIDTTRDFCKKMISLNRLYSRKDIESISHQLDYNVWEQRGGWYTNPKTGVPRPSCRHIWSQQLVTSKRKAKK